ncbi:MAG: alpha/beta hydrolase [Bdellovibrionales bacterium]|nr:alpha/beta hydrolase [Bdellovibrionales bacterium]
MEKTPKKTGYFKSFDGTKIYYEIRGTGKPMVFCYGIGCLMNHWSPQVKHFSSRYQVITFDYRAHHKSDVPEDRTQLTMDAYAQDIKYLMDHLELNTACFVGHSWGGQVLIRAYDMFPELFSSLIFINGFVKNPIAGMFGNNYAGSFFQLFKSGYSQLPETLSYIWKKGVNNPLAIQLSALAGGFNIHLTSLKDIEIYARGLTTMDLNSFLDTFESMMNYDGSPVLDRVQVPTLIIGGKKDAVTPQKHQENMHIRIKGSQFLMIPYGSHCTQLDMPDFVNLKIDHFLNKITYF